MSPLRIGLKVGQDATADELFEVWRIADEGGFDHLWCLDLYAAIGTAGPDRPIFEGWALQAAMAAATRRVRIGCAFTGNTHRPPWMLAKLAVTVDNLSHGRLEFGIGAGYEEVEHRMYEIGGLDHRVGRLEESLDCLKLLWTHDRVDFAGRYYRLREAIANPKPLQQPHPPIWIGAGGQQLLRVVARHADVWHCPVPAVDAEGDPAPAIAGFKASAGELAERCAEIGRDPAEIRRCIQIPWRGRDRDSLLRASEAWLAAGCTEQIVYLHPLQLETPGVVAAAEAAAEALEDLRGSAG